ncbi:MAG TPA: glucodextranase DOMON-like domain-containing protein [Trueperaceae bacterium]|nr:glucodextranase DOMON-like domain-containing protein [Trueperaceae bacterium]
MHLITLVTLAALTLTDPTSDALGDGTLTPPTSPIYAHSAIFDIHEVVITTLPQAADGSGADGAGRAPAAAGSALATLAVTMGAVDPDDGSAAGFSGVVIDVYFDAAPGGSEITLVGPGMLLPAGGGWEYAVRLSPAGAFAVSYDEPPAAATSELAGAVALPPQAAMPQTAGSAEADDPGVGGPGDAAAGGVDGGLTVEPLELTIDGNRLIVPLPWPLAEQTVVYAVSGVYDPFSNTSWRPLANTTSPWAYSGGDQVAPVIDVLAADQAVQLQALSTGVLPRPQRTGDSGLLWLLLMAAGVVIAGVGLWLRRQVKAEPTTTGLPYGLPPEKIEADGAEVDDVAVVADAVDDVTFVEDELVQESADDDPPEKVVTTTAESEVVERPDAEVTTVPAPDRAAESTPDAAPEPESTTDAAPELESTSDAAPEPESTPDPFDRFGSLDAESEEDEVANDRFEGERL